jgi:hypothetical protein
MSASENASSVRAARGSSVADVLSSAEKRLERISPLTVTVSIFYLFDARTTTGLIIASGSLATAGIKDTAGVMAGDATATGFCENCVGSADAAL